MGKLQQALGLMSGTSLDGIDVALVATDGDNRIERGPAMTFPYTEEQQGLLREATRHAATIVRRTDRPGLLPVAERTLTELHAAAVSAFLRKQGIDRDNIDVIGFHGQTVLHRPAAGVTVQLGDGSLLAELTGIDVVYDMRAADVAAGGQGAPLVPAYHRALVSRLAERPVAVLNIGGVANVTWIGQNGDLIAFDTGPGNALIDDWMRRTASAPYDDYGALAAVGRADHRIVTEYLKHSHFSAPPPKSLDRHAFPSELVDGLTPEAGAATLTLFTATAIARAREHFPVQPALWIVCGGGRRNRTLMGLIAGSVENAVVPAEAAGLDGDSVEAEAWAYLAVRSRKGYPLTFPGTTGVPTPLSGGVLAKADC